MTTPGPDESFLYLPDSVLGTLGIGTADIVGAIEAAVAGQAANAVWTAPKAALMPGDGRYMMTTLSVADEPGVTVVKSVMVSPDNPSRGLPGINGAILVTDARTGLLRAVVGANWVTAVRTAGLSAVAATRLADPASRSIAFVGCGVQALSHLDAFCDIFPIAEIRAVGRGRANAERLCDAARAKGLSATVETDARAALETADIVVSSITLDYTIAPFLDARWLKPGAFAAITDLAIPWHPEGMPAFGTVVIDDREQEAASPKPMIAPDLISADLTDIATGRIAVAHDPSRPSAFVFRGIAIGDLAVTALALERAEAAGAGIRVAP